MNLMEVRARLVADGVSPETVTMFFQSFQAQPDVWRQFEKFTLESIAKKIKRGSKAIMERVRWECEELEPGRDWKCNNNFTAYYARVFSYKYPEHRDYFEFRRVEGLRRAA